MSTAVPACARRVVVARWAARLSAVALVLFWGGFFVHHTVEWFTDPSRWPPPYVIAVHGLHGLMLLGLILGWRWELAGALLVIATAVPFFTLAAGPNAALFIAATVVPAVLWLYTGRRGGGKA
jgi:hypothetical protein